jgi:hypothetical protein
MDRNPLSVQEHEIEYLALKHGMSVETVKAFTQIGGRSREQVEAALDMELPCLKRFLFGPV